MARSDELVEKSKKQAKSSGSSPRGNLNLKEAEKVLSQADLSAAAGSGGSAIKKSCGFQRKILSLDISSRGSSPRGDLYLEEAEKLLSRAGLSGATTAGGSGGSAIEKLPYFHPKSPHLVTFSIFDENDKSLEQSGAKIRGVDLLQKAAIEYCSAKLLATVIINITNSQKDAAQCYERAAELLNFRRIDHTSFTILSKATKCYEKNVQYDKAEQVTLKLINMATEINDVSRIAKFNCKLANIYVLKQLFGEASKHYEIAYNLYRVENIHFYCCIKLLEKQANLSILQNDSEGAAKYFLMIVEDCHKDKSGRLFNCEYIVKACLSFLVDNPKKSSDYFKEKRQNANFSQICLDMVKGIIDAVQENNYDSFKSIIRSNNSLGFDRDDTLRNIVFAIEKKYFNVENGSEKKYGKLHAAADDINLENLLEDEKIDRGDHNKSKIISKDNLPTDPSLPKSSINALGKGGEGDDVDHDDDEIDLK